MQVSNSIPRRRICLPQNRRIAAIQLAAVVCICAMLSLSSQLPVLVAVDRSLSHDPAVGFFDVWANGTHSALCDPASMKSGSAVACTEFLRRRTQERDNAGDAMFAPWSLLGFHGAPEWAEAIAINADIIAAAAASVYSQRLPPCTRGVAPGVTVTTKYDWNIYYHIVMRGLWWQHRYGVVRAGGEAAARAVSVKVVEASRLRGLQSLPDSERAALRSAAVGAAGIDTLWVKLDGTEETGTTRVDPLLGDLLRVLARTRSQEDGVKFLEAPSVVHCFASLIPAFTHSFGVEASQKWTPARCSAASLDDSVPLFVAQLRAALGVLPPPTLDSLPAPCHTREAHPGIGASGRSRRWRVPLSDLCSPQRPLLFAKRAPDGKRALHNEAQLITALEAAGATVNAVVFGGTEWPPEAQAKATTGACGLVGLHGSALTNLLFLARQELSLQYTPTASLGCPQTLKLIDKGDTYFAPKLVHMSSYINYTFSLPWHREEDAYLDPDALSKMWGDSMLRFRQHSLALSSPIIEIFPHVLAEELTSSTPPPQLAVYFNLACAAHVPYAAYISPPEPGVADPRATYLGRDVRSRGASIDVDAVVALVLNTLERSLGEVRTSR